MTASKRAFAKEQSLMRAQPPSRLTKPEILVNILLDGMLYANWSRSINILGIWSPI